MIRTLFALTLICLVPIGCSEATQLESGFEDSQTGTNERSSAEERPQINPAERPVRIGLGGPRFDACQAVGRIQGLRGRELDVRIAPFDAAKKKGSIRQGQQVWICTRSHDQQWHGIVYDDGDRETAENDAGRIGNLGPGECGVSSPVRSKRNYDGPCKSGWVESNFVKLVAG